MRVPVDQIAAAPKRLCYAEAVGELNERLAHGGGELCVRDGIEVDLCYYRAGLDVVFEGRIHGGLEAPCGRCLEEYRLPVDGEFRVVLAPKATEENNDGELKEEDLGIGFFEGDTIDVTDVVHEQVLLTLPSTWVCRDDCRGLCATCGANLNEQACGCPPSGSRPRMAVLHDLLRNRSAES